MAKTIEGAAKELNRADRIRAAWKALGVHPKAEEAKRDLRDLVDGSLLGATPEVTAYNVGRRDVALDILQMMEAKDV